MSNNDLQQPEFSEINFAPGVAFARKAIWWWLPILYLLISDCFYLRTYDSAQVKITLLQLGGFAVVGLWLSLLALEGRKAFRKEDFVFLAPFFAYLVYVIISFCHAPYKGGSVDDLVRYFLYMSVSIIVLREFNESAIKRLTQVLLVAAYITVLYGFVQFLDTRLFLPEQGTGVDPFTWRWAFSGRVFSTYGNPNFFGNFLVLILPIVVTQYLKNRSLYLLPLIFLDLLCLYATDTKGAWIGFGISTCVFTAIYIYFFTQLDRKKLIKTFFVLLAAALVVIALVLNYARRGNATSITFRVSTWLSTWEMIETHPLIGTGVGSFKVVYPAYRRPIIFHIEGGHNTETDHAEEEHLEQWLDNGLIGFGIYLWLIIFVITVGLRGLNSMTETLKGNRPPPAAYDLLGYLTALLGMLFHNFTDVSMRFVSSGVFLGLLPGVIINLARGQALWELHYREEKPDTSEVVKEGFGFYDYSLWALRAAAVAGVVYVAYLLTIEFSEAQGRLASYIMDGDILQWRIAWMVFLPVVLILAGAFININLKGLSRVVPLITLIVLLPIYYFWGWFKGDVYQHLGSYFDKQGKLEDSLSYYKRVMKLDPYFTKPYYYVANYYKDRFNMERQYRKDWGDENGIPRTDFDRAMSYYEALRALAPNYVQMHYQVGVLYMQMHDHYLAQGKTKEAAEYYDKALARLELSGDLDPIYPPNYYRKAQIYNSRLDYASAEREFLNDISAWKCFLPAHKHETPEDYTYLGNIQSAMGKYKEAYDSYGRALSMNPEFQPAKNKHAALKQQFGFTAPLPPPPLYPYGNSYSKTTF